MAKLKVKIIDVKTENGKTLISVELTRFRKSWNQAYMLKSDRPVTTEQLLSYIEDLNPHPPQKEKDKYKDIAKNIGKEYTIDLTKPVA